MDTLALLCNLHADGPATLQRLRRAGCESLAALRRFDVRTLAQRLDWNERTAERFLREAALLCERLEDEDSPAPELEQEEFELESSVIEELSDAGSAEGALDESEESELDEEEEGELEEEVESGFAPPPERVEAVLGAWRELDRVAPPSAPTDFVIPRPSAELAPDQPLAGARLAGLDAPLRSRLAELGVRTLREFVAARELELVRSVPIAYTRLKHLQFLAARALAQLPVEAAPPAQAARPTFEAYAPPPVEPFETAGPFA